MKKMSLILVIVMLMGLMSGTGVFAESAEIPTLNVDVDTGEMTVIPVVDPFAKGIVPWGGEEVDKLFDGLYGVPSDDAMASHFRTDEEKGTKLGGQVTAPMVTVDFFTEEASAIRYYTFYTGFDTAMEPRRNPIEWTLYGVDGNGDIHILHDVVSNESVSTGMQAINCAPYTYQVPAENVGKYSEYFIEFVVSGEYFQLNEIVLFGDVGAEEEPADPPSDEPPAGTTAPTGTAPATDGSASGDTDSDADAPVIPIVITAVAVIAVAAVVVTVVLKKKKK
ncbi:MAG: hypothetical protein IJX76_10305 [Clostridia bacterium]|nr:hypothetical protein [Clostridia bacterium]